VARQVKSKSKQPKPATQPVQALLVYLKLSDDDIGEEEEETAILGLELGLERMVRENGVGTYEWHEVGGGYYMLTMYGPDVEKLFGTVLPALMGYPAMPGSFLAMRYGGPEARVRMVELSSRPLPSRIAETGQITFDSDVRH
jgi:hypothetical protein